MLKFPYSVFWGITMNILEPLSLPLNQSVLIEASAGTGKTYTMANLYLRLILGIGCEPLTTEQILVVTFTKAATQELRDRIRTKLGNVARWFQDVESEDSKAAFAQDPFLFELYQAIEPNLNTARLRLKIAEREMDLASIFTIDSFSQKMLFQYAFDSGMRFDIDLQPDEKNLLARLSEESWRELFYSMSLAESELVRKHLKTPAQALKIVQASLSGSLPALSAHQSVVQSRLADFAQQKSLAISQLKQFWQENSAQISALVLGELDKKYPPKTPKSLSRRSYTPARTSQYLAELDLWAKTHSTTLPANWEKFTQSFIANKAEKGADPLVSPLLEQAEQLAQHYLQQFSEKQEYNILIFRFLTHLRKKLSAYKQSHREKSFNDITDFLHTALQGENGDRFAQAIRTQFRFAMIDEFQDTNRQQYEIFQRIFIQGVENQGFIMIGDPKQSIYKFRHADIFSYLNAAKQVDLCVTMDKNWRSVPQIVSDINALFSFPENGKSPFIYQGIQFQAVQAKEPDETLQGASQSNCYLLPEFDVQHAAEYCAYHIQQQLKLAAQGKLFLQKNGEKHPLAAKDITILVRGKNEAELIKHELWQRKIQAIYLSARDSVYESAEAQELLFILQACVNPYHQGNLLTAVGTSLWSLAAHEIFQLKHDEQRWESYVEQFIHYHRIWQQQGILPMLHKIFLEQGIIQRLSSQENAERRITDLLHLAELLQEAMLECRNESALIQWFQQQLNEPNGQSDEQKLRLESEQALIKIVTIHGSKGLEYPVVWLPFIAKASKPFSEIGAFGKKNTPTTYHDENHALRWAFSPLSEQEQQQLTKEEFAEDLRLLYVALTRAKHQLNLILPEQFDENWNSVSYLLSNGEIGLGGEEIQQPTEQLLAQKQLRCQIQPFSPVLADTWQATNEAPTILQPKVFQTQIHSNRQLTSFSALHAQHERLQNRELNQPLVISDDAQDYDRSQDYLAADDSNEESKLFYSPFSFPHNTKVGNVLHKVFEEWHFAEPLTSAQIQEKICQPLDLSEEWLEPLQLWLKQIIYTPFADNLRLADFASDKRLNEWQFYLRLRNEKALPQLNQLLKAESRLAKNLPDFHFKQLDGFVRGFVDMVVQVAGKFYIIDYKSNYLGKLPQDYCAEKIEKAMGQYRYDLQYLLYTLALHRYLNSRLGKDYSYEKHFGGVAYLFLRGMNGELNSGVYFDLPSQTLIEKLDQLFD